jgi:hypothetical protein
MAHKTVERGAFDIDADHFSVKMRLADPRRCTVMSGEISSLSNRIDASLARGYSRMALAEAMRRAGSAATAPAARKISNEVARRRHLARRIDSLGEASLGAVASPGCKRAAIAFLKIENLTPHWPGIAVMSETIDFDVSRVASSKGKPLRSSPEVDLQIDAFLDIHAMKRLSQRLGRRSLDDYLKTVMPLLGWLRVARLLDVIGTFQIPMETGILCCDRGIPPDAAKLGAIAAPVTRIVTYLDMETATETVQQRWRRMSAAGALLHRPRYPRVGMPLDIEVSAMEVMRREGARWERRLPSPDQDDIRIQDAKAS